MVKQYLRSVPKHAYNKGYATRPARQGQDPVPPVLRSEGTLGARARARS